MGAPQAAVEAHPAGAAVVQALLQVLQGRPAGPLLNLRDHVLWAVATQTVVTSPVAKSVVTSAVVNANRWMGLPVVVTQTTRELGPVMTIVTVAHCYGNLAG